MDELHIPRIVFGQPVYYKIRVQGILSDYWFEIIEGMNMTVIIEEYVTVVKGWVLDQCHLSGILNTLNDIHLPIISVEIEESKDSHIK